MVVGEKKMCSYCANWYEKNLMQQLQGEPDYWYCPSCYPEVKNAHDKLPWNRNR